MNYKPKQIIVLICMLSIIIYLLNTSFFRAILYKMTHKIHVKDFWSYVYIYREIFINKEYDAILPKEGDVIFDVGGNQGLYSLYLNDKFKNIHIHVFEPIPDLFQQLQGNISRNVRRHNSIIMNNFGLSDRAETLDINYFPYGSGLSTLTDDMEDKQDVMIDSKCSQSLMPSLCKSFMEKVFIPRINKNKLKQKVELKSMSSYIEQNNIQKINIVKIDVEGHELQVLKGITSEHFNIIDSFIIEVENYRPGYLQEILNILTQHKYNIQIIDEDKKWCIVVASKKLYTYN